MSICLRGRQRVDLRNMVLAVNQDVDYSLVAYGDKKFYVASDRVEKVMTDEKHQPLEYSIVKTIKGSELVGKRFEPLFENRGPAAHKILHADFVTTDDGTGIVHIAPATVRTIMNCAEKMTFQCYRWLTVMEIIQKADGWVATSGK